MSSGSGSAGRPGSRPRLAGGRGEVKCGRRVGGRLPAPKGLDLREEGGRGAASTGPVQRGQQTCRRLPGEA